MKRNQLVTQIMSTEVTTVHTGQRPSDIRRVFVNNSFHHLPVVSGKKLVGIISTTDMIRLSFEAFGTDDRSLDAILDSNFTVEEIMNCNLVTLSDRDTVRDAAVKLSTGAFHALPVIDEDKDLVGVVTTTDLVNFLIEQY